MAGNFEGIKTRNFGIEIEMTGLSRCQAARTIAKVLGGTAFHEGSSYDKYTVDDEQGRTWSIVYDGSVKCESDEEVKHTISYDEKTGIQAIACTSDDRAPIPGTAKISIVQRDYEYKRLGTLSLLAGIDLLCGESIPYISETHKSSDFVCFLKKLDEKYSNGDKIRLILDNHSAHTSKETQEYLNTIPGRFEFVFTPKHGSWLNMIEGFFSKMTKQMLGGIRVETKKELEDRIYRYFDEINKEPVPYKWTYKMDTIDLSKEDIDSIVYEVVNAKAASAENKNKKAPKPISRKSKSIQN